MRVVLLLLVTKFTAPARKGCRLLKRASHPRSRRPRDIEGLTDAMLNEMIDLGHGITGLAINLEETEVGVIVFDDYTELEEGDEAHTTGYRRIRSDLERQRSPVSHA
jgi:hypothetical protein